MMDTASIDFLSGPVGIGIAVAVVLGLALLLKGRRCENCGKRVLVRRKIVTKPSPPTGVGLAVERQLCPYCGWKKERNIVLRAQNRSYVNFGSASWSSRGYHGKGRSGSSGSRRLHGGSSER